MRREAWSQKVQTRTRDLLTDTRSIMFNLLKKRSISLTISTPKIAKPLQSGGEVLIAGEKPGSGELAFFGERDGGDTYLKCHCHCLLLARNQMGRGKTYLDHPGHHVDDPDEKSCSFCAYITSRSSRSSAGRHVCGGVREASGS